MSFKAFKVDGFVVRDAVLPHAPEYFKPPLGQASQRASVTMSAGTFGRVIGLSPQAGPSALVSPQMGGVTQKLVAGPADPGLADLARLETHWASARAAAQAVCIGENVTTTSELSQQARCQFIFGARQTAEDVVIRVVFERQPNLLSILINLLLQALQNVCQTQCQQRFGFGDCGAGIQLLTPFPTLQASFSRLGPPQFVAMQEFLPLSLAGFVERFWRRKGVNKGPSERLGPIIKALQRQRKVLPECRLELINQGGALLDQDVFITTQQAQGTGGFILGHQLYPSMTVSAQRVSHAPGIKPIGLAASRRFALPIPLSCLGINRIHLIIPLQQLVYGWTARGLDAHRTFAEGLHLLLKLAPALSAVREFKIGHNVAEPIHDNNVVVILSPIEGSEIISFVPICIHSSQGARSHWHSGRAQPDTGALLGRRSLSAWPGCRHRSRRSLPNARGVWDGEPCLRCGELLTDRIMPVGKVIHQLGRRVCRPVPSPVNNFGNRIRDRVRAS